MERGIYCVAFGDPARACARRMIETAKRHMPEIPIALASSAALGPEDHLLKVDDSDVGARRAKLLAYELAPAEWGAVLYLDADTEVIAPAARFYFELIEAGWEFVICRDATGRDTLHSFRRPNNLVELNETAAEVYSLHTLQFNGGVWSFGRGPRVAAFFKRWQAEWERHGQRDQGALIRAMHADPLKVYVLGNEWNYFDQYSKDAQPAAIKHYPGRARRWDGMIPGRIDSPAAWAQVRAFERKRGVRT